MHELNHVHCFAKGKAPRHEQLAVIERVGCVLHEVGDILEDLKAVAHVNERSHFPLPEETDVPPLQSGHRCAGMPLQPHKQGKREALRSSPSRSE